MSDNEDDPFTFRPDKTLTEAELNGYYISDFGLDGAQNRPQGQAKQLYDNGGKVTLPQGQEITIQSKTQKYRDSLRIVTDASKPEVIQAFKVVHYKLNRYMSDRMLYLREGFYGNTLWTARNWGKPPKSAKEQCMYESETHLHPDGCAYCDSVSLDIY